MITNKHDNISNLQHLKIFFSSKKYQYNKHIFIDYLIYWNPFVVKI